MVFYDEQWENVAPQPGQPAPGGTRAYAGLVGVIILAGFLFAGVGVAISWLLGAPIAWAVPGLGLVYIGVETAQRHGGSKLSVAGHLLSSIGVGVFLAPLLLASNPRWANAAILTVLGTGALTLVAFALPGVVRRMGAFLLALAAAAGVALTIGENWPALTGLASPDRWTFAVAGAALLYIDLYWSRIWEASGSVEAAVDTANLLYTDPATRIFTFVERALGQS